MFEYQYLQIFGCKLNKYEKFELNRLNWRRFERIQTVFTDKSMTDKVRYTNTDLKVVKEF